MLFSVNASSRMPRHGNARSLRAGLGAEQRQEPWRAGVTFVRAALAQNHASGRHEPRSSRNRRRQPRAARPVSPAVQDHGSLLVLKANGASPRIRPYPRSEQVFALGASTFRRAARHGGRGRKRGDTSLLERGDHVNQVAQAAAEPVKAPDDERVV